MGMRANKYPGRCAFASAGVLKGRISIKIYLWYVLSMGIFLDNIHFTENSFEKFTELMYTVCACSI